jgi:drug/metabolite transporter (DMT)-like permease
MAEKKQPHMAGAELTLLTVVVIWAVNFPVAKLGIAGLGVTVFNFCRFLVATTVLMILHRTTSSWTPVRTEDRGKIIVVSILSTIVYQVAFVVGLSLTSAGNSAVILSTAPLWILFFSSRMNNERIEKSMWIGMTASLAGIIMIIVGSGKNIELGSSGIAGDLITLAAAALWGLTTNLQKPLLGTYPAIQLNLIMAIFGTAGLTVIALPDLYSLDLTSVEPSYVAAAVASGALSIGIANMLWSVGVKKIGPSKAGNFGNLVPVLAFLIAYLALDEHILFLQVVGSAITIGGVWLARS